MSSSEPVRKAVAGYFSDPRGRSANTGTDRSGAADNLPLTKENISQLKDRLENSIRKMNDLKSISNQVEMTVTPEGLRIDLLESQKGTFFESGSSQLNANGVELLKLLAAQLEKSPICSRSRATPTRNHSARRAATPTGSYPRTAPMQPAA